MQKPTNVRWIVLFGLCLAAGFAYVHRVSLAAAESTIRKDLDITTDQTGLAGSIFFWLYAFFQIPTGILVDRWGARRSLLLFGMLCAATMALGAATMLFGAAIGFAVFLVSRGLMGVAQAGLFPAATRCIATWFPLNRRGAASGALQAFMSVGGVIGTIVTAQLLKFLNWPIVFMILAIPALIWSLWFFWWYRDRPEDHRSVNDAEKELLKQPAPETPVAEPKGPTPWLKLLTSPKLFWLCASQYFRAAAIAFWLVWCPTYLQNTFGIDRAEAGMLNSITLIGVMLGNLFGGLLLDRVLVRTNSKRWSRNGVSICTAAIGIAVFIAAYFARDAGPYVCVGLLFVAAFFTACGNPCSYSVSIDIGGRYMAVVFGAMNMIGNFGSATLPLVVPPWSRAFGWDAMPLLLALVFFIGMLCWFFVNPNGVVIEEDRASVVVDD